MQPSPDHGVRVEGTGCCTAEISRSVPGSVSGEATTPFPNFPSDKCMPGLNPYEGRRRNLGGIQGHAK